MKSAMLFMQLRDLCTSMLQRTRRAFVMARSLPADFRFFGIVFEDRLALNFTNNDMTLDTWGIRLR